MLWTIFGNKLGKHTVQHSRNPGSPMSTGHRQLGSDAAHRLINVSVAPCLLANKGPTLSAAAVFRVLKSIFDTFLLRSAGIWMGICANDDGSRSFCFVLPSRLMGTVMPLLGGSVWSSVSFFFVVVFFLKWIYPRKTGALSRNCVFSFSE